MLQGEFTKVSGETLSGETKYGDPGADELRARYHQLYEADELPVPLKAIAAAHP